MRKTNAEKPTNAVPAVVEGQGAARQRVPLDYETSQPKATRQGLGDTSEVLLLIAMVILPVITSPNSILGPFVLGFGCGGSYEIVRRGKRQFAGLLFLSGYALATLSQIVCGIWNLFI